MLKKILAFILLHALVVSVYAQQSSELKFVRYSEYLTPPFKIDLNYAHQLKLNLASTSFVNWRQNDGAANNISIGVDYDLERKFSYLSWSYIDQFIFRYGMQKVETQDIEKTIDFIQYKTKLNYRAINNLYYTAEGTAQTQLTNSYDKDTVLASTFLSPLYTSIGIGASFQTNFISVYVSPITGRITTVLNQELADKGFFGVKPATFDANKNKLTDGENNLVELGLLMEIDWKIEIMKNIKSRQKIRLYSDYRKSFGVYDVDWQSNIEMQVNDLFAVDFRWHIIYDEDVKFYEKDTNKDGLIDSNDNGIAKTQILTYIAIAMTYKF